MAPGLALAEQWVLLLTLSPIRFMILSQPIIVLPGWEWDRDHRRLRADLFALLKHFNIDPTL
jgi:hypothetical protein